MTSNVPSNDYNKIITGEGIKPIVRIRKPLSVVKEDLKSIGDKIALLDPNNRRMPKF